MTVNAKRMEHRNIMKELKMNRVKVKAWGPFQIYMNGYTAPDIKTGSLVYLSIFHGLIANLVLNNIFIFLLPDSIPVIFKVTFGASLLYGAAYAFLKVGRSKDHTLRMYSTTKALAEILFLFLGFVGVLMMAFSFLYVGMASGFKAVYIVYCVVHPFIFYPVAAAILAHVIANIMRLLTRNI